MVWVREELICAGYVAVPDTTRDILTHIKHRPHLCLEISWVKMKRGEGRVGEKERKSWKMEGEEAESTIPLTNN